MANEDFVIEDGVLRKYNGNGGDVVIPEGVTKIGPRAFEGCTLLASVAIPQSVTEIGGRAFAHCGLQDDFKIEAAGWRFENCVAINDGVVKYLTNSNVTNITIPEGVTKIGGGAFFECKSLASVAIPQSVTEIGDRAFKRCGLQDDFKIEAAGWRFENCVAINDGVVKYCANSNVTNITIPEGVTAIGDYAFQNCTSLVSVTIPESVTAIGDWAFHNCTSLTSITLSKNVTAVGEDAFRNCAISEDFKFKTKAVRFENSLLIRSGAVAYCTNCKAEKIVIPSGVKKIRDGAFEGCESLKSVEIPEGVKVSRYGYPRCKVTWI